MRTPIILASLTILAAAPAVAGCGERAAAPAAPRGDLVVLRAGAERTLTLGAGAPLLPRRIEGLRLVEVHRDGQMVSLTYDVPRPG